MDRPRAPDLEELRTFCVAAELGTLGRAATRLHVTQPAVSKRLRSLEEHCGVRLLDRTGRGVTLTPAGERLYAHARRILVEMTDLAATIEELRGSAETVTLAISPTAADALLSAALMRLQREPNAPVEVDRRQLAHGQADGRRRPGRRRRRRVHARGAGGRRALVRCSTTRS